MESTSFFKDFLNLVAYDKQHPSTPFYLIISIATIVLGGMFMAIPAVDNADIAIQAFGDGISCTLLYVCVLENYFEPEKIRKLIDLIEEDFYVSREDFIDRGGTWQEIDTLHESYRSSISFTSKFIKVAIRCLICGVFLRNILYSWFQVPVYQGELPESFGMVPFLYYIPPEFDQPIFFIYCYILGISVYVIVFIEGYMMVTILCLSIARVLVEFDTMYILVNNFCKEYKDFDLVNESEDFKRMFQLKADMARIVTCHQRIIRNLKTCADNSQFAICCIPLTIFASSCVSAFFILKASELRKAVVFVLMFSCSNLVLFLIYQNGQQIFNQNDKLRRSLLEVPWTDKPRWLRQAMHIMLTQANRDMQIKPYGIFVLNYMSFKDLMKFTFSVGNVLYSRKQLTSHSQ